MSGNELHVRDLRLGYSGRTGILEVVRDVELTLVPGRIVGLAGESGCGKSTSALAAIAFDAPGAVRIAGRSELGDVDLLSLSRSELRTRWGRDLSYVAQDAARSLDPLQRVRDAFSEILLAHTDLRGQAVQERASDLLEAVGFDDTASVLARYPHQFSGGQQQRITLGLALAADPEVLVLDEPTTGLDVTAQAQIMELIRGLVTERGIAALAVSHDLALLATVCEELVIMYGGEIVEQGPAGELYSRPRHPYTAALLDAMPRPDERGLPAGIPGRPPNAVVEDACAFADRCTYAEARCRAATPPLTEVEDGHHARCVRTAELGVLPSSRLPAVPASPTRTEREAILAIEDLRCTYPGAPGPAVDGVSLTVARGETVCIVGESGSGKSTLLRTVAGLHTPDSGSILFDGDALPAAAGKRPREQRRRVQLIFQNPDSSLNPRHTIERIVTRPMQLFRPELDRAGRREEAERLIDSVRLDAGVLDRRPDELSGGQRQRIAIARGFAANPDLLLCDEVVSALDVSVQASVLELLATLSAERDTAVLFVTHDLGVVRTIADWIYVMRDGRTCESGSADAVLDAPEDSFTRQLLASIPRPAFEGRT